VDQNTAFLWLTPSVDEHQWLITLQMSTTNRGPGAWEFTGRCSFGVSSSNHHNSSTELSHNLSTRWYKQPSPCCDMHMVHEIHHDFRTLQAEIQINGR